MKNNHNTIYNYEINEEMEAINADLMYIFIESVLLYSTLRKMNRTNKFVNLENNVSTSKKSTSTEKQFDFGKSTQKNNGTLK